MLDHDVPTRLEVDPPAERGPYVFFDSELVEDRDIASVQLHPVEQLRAHLAEIRLDLLRQLLRIHRQRIDLLAEQVTDDAGGECRLTVHGRGRLHARDPALHLLPRPP